MCGYNVYCLLKIKYHMIHIPNEILYDIFRFYKGYLRFFWGALFHLFTWLGGSSDSELGCIHVGQIWYSASRPGQHVQYFLSVTQHPCHFMTLDFFSRLENRLEDMIGMQCTCICHVITVYSIIKIWLCYWRHELEPHGLNLLSDPCSLELNWKCALPLLKCAQHLYLVHVLSDICKWNMILRI